MRTSRIAIAVLRSGCAIGLLAILAAPAGAGDGPNQRSLDSLRERLVKRSCVTSPIQCGQTRLGTLDFSDCLIDTGYYADFWVFSGQVGQTVTIDATSLEFDTFLTLHTPTPGSVILAQDDDSGPGLDARISAVLTQTSSGWGIGVSSIGSTPFDMGSYAVTLTCSGSGQPTPTKTPTQPGPTATPTKTPTTTPIGGNTLPCVRTTQTACLLDDRFEVKVSMTNFATPPVAFPGIIQTYQGASSETDQSVSFYSFTEGNVEVFVKMVNACSTSTPRFWLFAAGATNAQTTINVRDTATGEVETITNPSGHVFTTVANTSAFATCP